jgi:septum formation protein
MNSAPSPDAIATLVTDLTTFKPLPTRSLILGSTSPYRRELLQRLRIPFEVMAPDVDETPLAGECPRMLATRLALAKARVVASAFPHAVVIGADQVADLNGLPLGKPGNHEKAVAQLHLMRGQIVIFQTAVAVVCLDSGFEQSELAAVAVRFRDLSDDEIENYLRVEQPYDCAGSAKSEGLGIALLESIDSDDPTALVGLPLIRTCKMIQAAGVTVLVDKQVKS